MSEGGAAWQRRVLLKINGGEWDGGNGEDGERGSVWWEDEVFRGDKIICWTMGLFSRKASKI